VRRKKEKVAIIVGAGPAGLTAAWELLERTNIKPLILEMDDTYVGGISRTVRYKNNRIDIGGHRFYSKSGRVMNWWLNILPLEKLSRGTITLSYQNKTHSFSPHKRVARPANRDDVMLVRTRKSRIYYKNQFFNYPISLNFDTVRKLGIVSTLQIGISYTMALLAPIKPEKSLEDFYINRFGEKLYEMFFKDYTRKVWGVSCRRISAEWGAQRVKGLSIKKTISQYVKKSLNTKADLKQKGVETTLIEHFLYPKYGPGQMWERVSSKLKKRGVKILMGHKVVKLNTRGNKVTSVTIKNKSGKLKKYSAHYLFSSMPVRNLIRGFPKAPKNVLKISDGLAYRDFITVGLLIKKSPKTRHLVDNWIYIQDKNVKVGRIQIFNNWSPYLIPDKKMLLIGLEYFCNKGDKLWNLGDDKLIALGRYELERIGFIRAKDVVDGTVIRMEKTYPAYFGTFKNFDKIVNFTDKFENLFLIGRNGMHKYNNQDHSMLTAMVAVDNIISGRKNKDNIWAVNTEKDYLEEK
jgi:protoporphyrinogen oxidase